ncbi:MAG: hypothetical protein Ta2F_05300 [Termitinemataceae bacterium]|nr:MAG: hypothetical protein Ta2F_05300 [Termitinemataceae bacterium]
MINLKTRLSLSYTLFLSAALLLLMLVINSFSRAMFAKLTRDNIAEHSKEIVRSVHDLYNPLNGTFDRSRLESLGMYFTHEGYIITVEDAGKNIIWDARSCDMEECNKVIETISIRMETDYNLKGSFRAIEYPVLFVQKQVGSVIIESYGPFFYSKTESDFLSSLNKLLFAATFVFIVISIGLSFILSAAIAKPVKAASAAARRIAAGHDIKLFSDYKTSELKELSESINDMAAELKEADRRSKQLTQDVAHELRTPITCLQSNLEAMIDGIFEPSKERLASCAEETKRLTKLVEDLTLLTNIEWQNIALQKN